MLDYHNDKLHTHVLGRLQVLRPLVRILGTPIWERAGGSGVVVVGEFNTITIVKGGRQRVLCSRVAYVVLKDR